MKEKRKLISIIFLFLIMGNLIITNTFTVVNAISSNTVVDTITLNNDRVTNLKEKLEALKQDELYQTDKSYIETVLYMEEEINALETELLEQKKVLEEGISLSYLINNYFTSKKDIFDEYFKEDILIKVDNLNDITYEYTLETNEKETRVLLTKAELEETLNVNYLDDVDQKISNYLTDFDTTKDNLIESYNDVLLLKDEKVLDLETKTLEINEFYEEEVSLGNNPNMVVSDTDINSYLKSIIESLNSEITDLTIKNIDSKKENINNLYNDALLKINEFYLNNKNYLENGLKEKIESFTEELVNINNDLSNEVNLEDYKNSNVSSFIDNVSSSFISVLDTIINNEENYNNLDSDINLYLERKPSDKENVNNLLNDINDLRTYLNKEHALNIIELLINNSDLTNEDVVDNLLAFKDFPISEELKEKLTNAKLSFYDLKLKDDTNYKMNIVSDVIILENITSLLLKNDFINNLDYNYKFEVIDDENITNNGKVIIYDRNDKLLKGYSIVIKGDINYDNVFDLKDVETLEEMLLKEDIKDVDRLDYNDDDLVDIEDLISMKKLLENEEETTNPTTSNFNVTQDSVDNYTYYKVTVKTDGIIKGFSFDLSTSSNLKFDSISTNGLNIKLNDDNTKVIATGNFKDDDTFTLCYKEDLSVSNVKEFNLSNIKFVYDNLKTNKISNIDLISTEENKTNSSNQTNVENKNNNISLEEIIPEEEIKEEEPKQEEPEVSDKDNEKEKEVKEEKEITAINVIKIIIIVLLGAVIIYFLNKKDNDEENQDFLNDDKTETK